jgi:hypothetical protein
MKSNKQIFDSYELKDYPKVDTIKFPKNVYIAYAVCGETCGNREFIVDGQTQVCQYCGKLMFRTEVKKYILCADSGSRRRGQRR